jgi:prevent-host-death family protein
MAATIPQRELRNRSGEILRQAEKGQTFTVTVDGRPVAVIGPYPRRQWVPRAELLDLLRSGPPDPEFAQDIAELGGTLEDLTDPWQR